MKKEQRKMGSESCLTASDESGNWGGITVSSIKFTKRPLNKNYFIEI